MLAAGTTISLAPMNVIAATTEKDDDGDKEGPALSKEIEISNPSGERTIAVEANDNSKNARVTQEQDTTHKVDPDKDDDKDVPAHTSTKVIESDDAPTEITRESGDESSSSAAKNSRFIRIEDETFNRQS
jgi:hypothetical protein